MNIELRLELPSKFARETPSQLKLWFFEARKRHGTCPPFARVVGITVTPSLVKNWVGAQITWGWF